LSTCRTAITEKYQSATSSADLTAGGWGCESASGSGKYVTKISTDANGGVELVLNGLIDSTVLNKKVNLIPSTTAGTAMTTASVGNSVPNWVCGSPDAEVRKYLPGSCSATTTALTSPKP